MLFDACYNERRLNVLMQLKDKTDYFPGIADRSPCPRISYEDFLPALFKDKADLEAVTKSFYEYYSNNDYAPYGTVSLIKTSELNELAQIVNEILKDKTEEDIYTLPLSNMQILEYLTYSSPHMLYDFDDFIKYLASDEQYQRFTACMEKGGHQQICNTLFILCSIIWSKKNRAFLRPVGLRAPTLSDEVVRLVQAACLV